MQEAQEAELIAQDALAAKRCPAAACTSLAPNQRTVLVDLLKEQVPDAVKALLEHYRAAAGGAGPAAAASPAAATQAWSSLTSFPAPAQVLVEGGAWW
jgi:hypothetical protein